MKKRDAGALVLTMLLCACGGGGGGSSSAPATIVSPAGVPTSGTSATPTPTPAASAASSLPALPLALNVNNLPGGFYGEIVAQFSGVSPRQMVMLPNGDLLVGTGGGTAAFAQSGQIYIVPNAEAATPGSPSVFTTLTDSSCASSAGTNTNGITFAAAAAAGTGGGTIFVGLECSVWKIPYVTGDRVASSSPSRFLTIRSGSPPPGSDGDVHHTTSLLAVGSSLYISIGSSCNACIESDPTRGTVYKSGTTTQSMTLVASRVRNALALAVNPSTSTVWIGGAGQDCMTGSSCFAAMDNTYALNGHPYEWMDALTTHALPADYMWPWCEENQTALTAPDPTAGTMPAGTNCANMIVSAVRAPAYSTIMAATFYSASPTATYAFPSSFQNGLFLTLHGSWHENTSGVPVAVPEVIFVPIASNDTPLYPMNWSNGGSPFQTWARNSTGNPAPFMNGFQTLGSRIGRPAGLAVGPNGSLFISDDTSGLIYRIRPGTGPH